jgi:hypothetical protein
VVVVAPPVTDKVDVENSIESRDCPVRGAPDMSAPYPAAEGLHRVVYIKSVLRALIAITLLMNEDLLNEKRGRIRDEDAPRWRWIARRRADDQVQGISEQKSRWRSFWIGVPEMRAVMSRLPPPSDCAA